MTDDVRCPRCNEIPSLDAVADTCTSGIKMPDGTTANLAFNVYVCHDCMIVGRDNVWDFRGIVWIFPEQMSEAEPQR